MTALWQRIQDEPAMFYAFVQSLIILGITFGLRLTDDQTGAILAVVALVLGLLTRKVVTPTSKSA